MRELRSLRFGLLLLPLLMPASCRSSSDTPAPPPDASRPVLKSEQQLAAERAERLQSQQVSANQTPVLAAEQADRPPTRRLPAPIRPPAGSIRPDVLLVNKTELTVADILYTLRDEIEAVRSTRTPRGLQEHVARLVSQRVRGEIGRLLVYEKAAAGFQQRQTDMLDKAVQREIDARVSREFAGSAAKFAKHLDRWGLSVERYFLSVKVSMVVSSYTREMLAPQVFVRRAELRSFYREHRDRYETPQTRELLLIEIPFTAFAPAGTPWDAQPPAAQAAARLKALRSARAAAEALKTRSFAEVATEFSHGLHASNGGSWGQIGRPLQPPYLEASRVIFDFEAGQIGEPLETQTGWYLAGCGTIVEGRSTSFDDVQDELRAEMTERRFNELASDYIFSLAETASISAVDSYVAVAVERATSGRWPAPAPATD